MSRSRLPALVFSLSRKTPAEQGVMLRGLSLPIRRELNDYWPMWSHPGQHAPDGDWHVWLIQAGRGFGKTRAGAEWVHAVARARPEARIALVGATAHEARRVMVEGESGLMKTARIGERMIWRSSTGELLFPSGARAQVYSADAPESLRGPEHHAAWCDELAKWRRGEAAWDNLMMGLRGGDRPQVLVTTTPKGTALMRRLQQMEGLVETRGGTRDNPHLPDSFVDAMIASYEGTWLGRQELDGEMIEEVKDALWTRAMIEAGRTATMPDIVRVVIGVDPPAGTASGRGGDACGIVAVALDPEGIAHVLDDASVAGASPERWARGVAACAARWGADRVVAESNQGGAMVRSVLKAADARLPVTLVHASRGKAARAEPIALLYATGRARHVGVFPALEDELCGLVMGGGYEGPGRSPDRADALVWAMSALVLAPRGSAGVRVVV